MPGDIPTQDPNESHYIAEQGGFQMEYRIGRQRGLRGELK